MKKLLITGHLGKDAVLRTDNTGNDYATFSVGVSVGTKDKPKTDWVEVSCSGKHLELVKYLKSGVKVLVEGFPTVNAYLAKEDNQPKASQKLFAHMIDILVFKNDDAKLDNMKADVGVDDIEEYIHVNSNITVHNEISEG